MSEQIKLTLEISNDSDHDDLSVELWLDNSKFFDQRISQGTHKIGHTFDEDEEQHQFRIVLKNKQHYHTVIDKDGNIITDTIIDIKNVSFDDINIDTLMHEHAVYSHKTNNEQNDLSNYKFYGHLGCNGTVTLDFHTPFYLWLLENM